MVRSVFSFVSILRCYDFSFESVWQQRKACSHRDLENMHRNIVHDNAAVSSVHLRSYHRFLVRIDGIDRRLLAVCLKSEQLAVTRIMWVVIVGMADDK